MTGVMYLVAMRVASTATSYASLGDCTAITGKGASP